MTNDISKTDQSNQANQAETLISVESLINNSKLKLDTLSKELKEHKQMLSSILENNDEYQDIDKEYKKVSQLKKTARQKIFQQTETAQLQDKIKENQYFLKELKTALSDYLSQYVMLSGSNKIEGPDGVLRQIIYSAKLVEAKS